MGLLMWFKRLFKTPLDKIEPTRYCEVCSAPLLWFETRTFFNYPICNAHIDKVQGAFDFAECMVADDHTARSREELAAATIQCVKEELQ